MHIKNKIFKILLILFVFTGQAVVAADLNFCNMDMAHMDMSQMGDDQQNMDCCDDDADCMMHCSISIVYILDDVTLFEVSKASSYKTALTSSSVDRRSLGSLFRPPIF